MLAMSRPASFSLCAGEAGRDGAWHSIYQRSYRSRIKKMACCSDYGSLKPD
jgi:hypothetical protein